MYLRYALAGVPAVVLLSTAVAVAWGSGRPTPRPEALKAGIDVGRARRSLMTRTPVGVPIEVALEHMREQGLACTISEPPLANLTWRVLECSTVPSRFGATLQVDVAGRNGVVADIGVEDRACLARADVTNPAPGPLDCDISSERLLAVEAQGRKIADAWLTEVLTSHPVQPDRHR